MKTQTITWHDVKSELPTESKWVIVTYADGKGVAEAYYNKKQKLWLTRVVDEKLETVTAWADMPEPYKGE